MAREIARHAIVRSRTTPFLETSRAGCRRGRVHRDRRVTGEFAPHPRYQGGGRLQINPGPARRALTEINAARSDDRVRARLPDRW